MAAVMTSDDVLADDAGDAQFELAVGPGDLGVPASMAGASASPLSSPPSGAMLRVSAPPQSSNVSVGGESSRPELPVSQRMNDASHPDVRVPHPSNEPDPPRIDPLEARAFADYGEPPASALQAPIYAFRVKTRQSELRRGLWRAKIAFERAQKDQSHALGDPSRLEEVKARLAADVETKKHDVDLHQAALVAFDVRASRRGMQIAFTTAAVVFLVIFIPVFFRMCVGVEAAPLPQ